MAYELLGVNGLTLENKQTYDALLIERAVPELVHSGMHGVQRDIPARGGNSIEWRGLARIAGTTGSLTEGTPGAEIQITFTNVAATILQYGKFIIVSDIASIQSIDDVAQESVGMLGEQMGDTRDLLARNVLVGGTTIQYASTAGSRAQVGSGMYLNWAEIVEAVSTLEANDAKRFEDGTYHGIIHPYTKRDMFEDTTIVDNMQEAAVRGADNPLFTGQVTDVAGVRFFLTTNADVQSSAGLSGADVYRTVVIGKNYFVETELAAATARMYVQPGGGVSDPLNQRSTIGWKMAYVAARLNNNFAVVVEHNTSSSTAA
ncbi:N4-gp56 family major capsid protein [Candidatus Pacearchaeota archaeon]|nr:N4-gp56 family major capsid protein [Candidatus Pacearchaeota archaeon]|tara:strand:- start:584 stop:1534 length:951 start_codon:yes stop_codon:yes gene_type:complete